MVSNDEVIRTLERIADLLEIRGENPFKVRAYRQAAVQVENLGTELSVIAGEEGLESLGGFGPAITAKVTELLETGHLPYLEVLEAEVPPSLIEVRRLAGIGPRTAYTLWKEAGITTVADLDAAARSGRLHGLPRLGARTVENIVRALDEHAAEGGGGRRPRDRVAPLATTLLEALRSIPEVERAEVAGSFRRGAPDVGDLDLLAATAVPAAVLAAYAQLPAVQRVLLRGDTKCSVTCEGLQVDCRAVAPDQFGAAWQYFTGSQAHNIRLRSLALRQGLILNEYGVFRNETQERIAGATEEDVYAALGLRWIPPEERVGGAEVERARVLGPAAVEV